MPPSLALRKPSPAPPLAAVEAFVGTADRENTPAEPVATPPAEPIATPGHDRDVPTFRRASRSVAKRRTKPDRRRATVYFDLDVARDLAAHVATADKEMSIIVNEALRAWLKSR